MYRVKLTARAKRGLKNLPKPYKEAVTIVINELKEQPTFGKPLGRELTGKFSIRIGFYRIIYKINSVDDIVLVLNIGHRSKVYN